MLKIKDNVDLKELEKFGFKIIDTDVFKSVHYEQSYFITSNKDKIIVPDKIIMANDLDVIYDLIQAGLVEKVGDK